MHWYQMALAIGAITAGVLAWNVPRAVFWIAIGSLSFIASSWWHDAGLPYGAAFGAATNLAICFALYAIAELRWEMRVWNCFHLMILIEIMYLYGIVESHADYAVGLELANWLALIVIGATGIVERAGHGIFSRPMRGDRAGRFASALYAERKHPPFWQVK